MASSSQQEGKGDRSEHGELQKTYKRHEDALCTLPKGKAWWRDHLFQYQGFWIPPTPQLVGLMLIQDHFRCRPDDIISATPPKCGTTWLKCLIFAIINRNFYDFASHPLLTEDHQALVPFFEAKIWREESYPPLETLPSPRLLSTHIPYTLFPESVKASNCRFVYICRNPKDVFVSKWHFANKLRSSSEMPPLSLDDAFERFCEGVSHYGPFWDHVLSYWKASLERPQNVLFLKYEDLKRNPLVEVKKMAEFLGMPFSLEEEGDGLAQKIVELCSFENLSNLEVNKSLSSTIYPIKNPCFFRKGEVGDWKNLLTPAMAARLDEITKKKLDGSGLELSI